MTATRSDVFDCNIFLQSMLTTKGPSYACWQTALAERLTLFVTPYILSEIRKLPFHKNLQRFRSFTPERVERFIEEVIEVADFVPDPIPLLEYSRDPADAHYVDLAIITGANVIVSYDNDLLDLMLDTNAEGKALLALHPSLRVLTPPSFLEEFRRA